MTKETYASVDIEADGPIPGPYSLLSIGAAAFDIHKVVQSTFMRNLHTLEGAAQDPKTMAFWSEHPQEWAETRKDCVSPETAMTDFVAWVDGLRQPAVFISWPGAYDAMWITWYAVKFAGRNPFTHSRMACAKSIRWGQVSGSFSNSYRKRLDESHWHEKSARPHVALHDAIAEGATTVNLLRLARGLAALPPYAGP